VNPRPSRFYALAAVALVALAISACSGASSPSNAATVNGTTITNDQLAAYVPEFKFLVSANGQTCGQGGPGVSATETQANCNRDALSYMIQNALIKQYADAHNITVSPGQVDQELTSVESRAGGASTFEAGLKKQGLSMAQFTDLLKGFLLGQNVEKAIANVTDQQIQQYYDQNKTQYTTVDAAHILVASKALAEKVKAEATTKNFAALAKKYSTDTGSASKGGELGSAPASQFVQPFADAVANAKPGTIIGPIQTQYGWHVIWVKSVKTQSLDQVKTQLQQQLAGTAFNSWLTKQASAASIKVNPRYGTFDKSTGRVVAVNSTTPSPVAVPSSTAGSGSPSP
jgi:foldase protein PrsA